MQLTSKVVPIFRASKSVAQRRSMAYVSNYKPPTLNDLPVPMGSWATAHSLKNRTYNMTLAAGVTIFTGTLFVFANCGIVDFGRGPKIGEPLD